MMWAVLHGRVVGAMAGAKFWVTEGGGGLTEGGRAGEAGERKVCGKVAR